MRKNGIWHVKSPPYHSSSNGLAEKAVQMLKEGLKKLKEGFLETRLSRFLFKYRITPHTSTGTLPVEVVFGHQLQSSLDKVCSSRERTAHERADQSKQQHDQHAKLLLLLLFYRAETEGKQNKYKR